MKFYIYAIVKKARKMPKIDKEAFIKRVYEIVNEMKIPLIDDRVYNRCVVAKGRASVDILFKYDGDESINSKSDRNIII